jgi:hypothetical protein
MTDDTGTASEPPRARLRGIGAGEITIVRLAIEIGIIVVGVLVALAATQWGQRRADGRLVAATVQAVRGEMAANVDALTRALELRSSQIERFRSGATGGAALQAAFLRTDAWETAQSVGPPSRTRTESVRARRFTWRAPRRDFGRSRSEEQLGGEPEEEEEAAQIREGMDEDG